MIKISVGLWLFLCSLKAFAQTNWETYPNNPVIQYGQALSGIIWNDPSVIKEGNNYQMWLSGGRGTGTNPPVNLYKATSTDGISWEIDTIPILSVGEDGSWDDERIETPNVIKVGSIYHLYYSGCTKTDDQGTKGIYNIGHATSTDGVIWIRDPNNPIITHTQDPMHWGFYSVAEPGVLHKNDKFYLFYTTIKARPGYEGIPDIGTMQGICLATSPDGSSFVHFDSGGDNNRDAVLIQSDNYPVENNYIGYSTPSALITNDGMFHLFYDVVQYPNSGDWRQVALAHATSKEGFNFTEIEYNIITLASEYWLNYEVRSPSVIKDGDYFKMWYAGHTDWFSSSGIGYASAIAPIGIIKPAKDLLNEFTFPNLYRSYDKITFSNQTNQCKIAIYNIAGELIYKKEYANANGTIHWNLKNQTQIQVGSGLYVYLITNDQKKKTVGKIGLIK